MRPLAIDLFCGLGGWTDGLLAEGYDVVGFDIERHQYGDAQYPAQLVLQDALTIHGKQFREAALIVASSPCQKYSYMAMPWTKAKDLAKWYRDPAHPERLVELNLLFEQPLRIQREAREAAGRFIPMVQENVRGAIPWVGRSRWNYGSFHLWGDVPALMPQTRTIQKLGIAHRSDGSTNFHQGKYGQKNVTGGSWFAVAHNTGSGHSKNARDQAMEGIKAPGMNWSDQSKRGQDFTRLAGQHAGSKNGGDWFNSEQPSEQRRHGSGSKARKAASAAIAKIPFPLASYIARTYHP